MRDRPNEQHRKVKEQALGRKLTPHDVVDHVNEDKADNAPANLRVMDRGAHTRQHNANRPLSKLRSALRMVREGRKLY